MNQFLLLAAINSIQQKQYISPSSEMIFSTIEKVTYDDYKPPKYMKQQYSKNMTSPICQPKNRGTNHSKPIKMARVVHC